MISVLDENMAGIEEAVASARGVVNYFRASSQAVNKLKEAQTCGMLPVYNDQKEPLTVIQGVPTRWWSDWRMLRRLRWLKPAITMLHVTGAIDCEVPSEQMWVILHQIEIALLTLAKFQRILEAEDYVTGSLVPLAIYRIRKAYVKVYQSAHTDIAVKDLTAILLADFDSRFLPANDDGKVTYTGKADVGFRNRYTALHPYLFVASFLDPRVKGLLHGNNDNFPYIMLPDQYEDLKRDVIDHMIALVYENKDSEEHDNGNEGTN